MTTSKPAEPDESGPKESRSRAEPGRFGIALAITGTLLFALKSIFIKLAYAEGGDATQLLTLRMLFSAPLYVGMLIYLRRPSWTPRPAASEHPLPRAMRVRDICLAMLLGFLGYYLAAWLDMQGLEHISAQLERLTLFTYPILIAILAAIFLNERLTTTIMLSLALSYAGIWLMYSAEQRQSAAGQVTLGMSLVLGSAISYALYIVLAKPMIARFGSREFTCWAMLGSTVFITIHFLLSERTSQLGQIPMLWFYGLLLAFVCTVIPSFLISEAIARIGATRTSIVGSIGPVITMLLAIVILSEPTSGRHFAGMLLAIVGVALVSK